MLACAQTNNTMPQKAQLVLISENLFNGFPAFPVAAQRPSPE